MKPVVEVENLSKRYEDGTLGIENLTLNIRPGEFVAVIGKSGSGKSEIATLLKEAFGCRVVKTGATAVSSIQ